MPLIQGGVLLLSALLFLGTAGFLIANGGAVANLFGKRRSDAEPGDIIADRPAARREVSPRAIKVALALHLAGLAGLVLGGLIVSGIVLKDHPGANPLPPEMTPALGSVKAGGTRCPRTAISPTCYATLDAPRNDVPNPDADSLCRFICGMEMTSAGHQWHSGA